MFLSKGTTAEFKEFYYATDCTAGHKCKLAGGFWQFFSNSVLLCTIYWEWDQEHFTSLRYTCIVLFLLSLTVHSVLSGIEGITLLDILCILHGSRGAVVVQ